MRWALVLGPVLQHIQHERGGVDVEVESIVHKIVKTAVLAAPRAYGALAVHDVTAKGDVVH